MKLFFKILGGIIILVGIYSFIYPERILSWVDQKSGEVWLYGLAIGFRALLGVLLILAAKESRFPGVLKILGYLTLLAVVVLLVIGHQGFQELITTVVPGLMSFRLAGAIVGTAFGGFLIYAFSTR